MTKLRLKKRFINDRDITIRGLLMVRTPSLVLGLMLGMAISLTTSQFKEVLEKHVQVAFFIPFVVYMADAVGTQTSNIFVRDLLTGKARFLTYLKKEMVIGMVFGMLAGVASAALSFLWLHDTALSTAVGLAMFAAVGVSPIVSLLTCQVLQIQHSDPAVGAGPLATVIQDSLSIAIFGTITGLLL